MCLLLLKESTCSVRGILLDLYFPKVEILCGVEIPVMVEIFRNTTHPMIIYKDVFDGTSYSDFLEFVVC